MMSIEKAKYKMFLPRLETSRISLRPLVGLT